LYLKTLTDKQYFIGEELIEFINDEGYIRENLNELTSEINHLKEGTNFSEEEITEEEIRMMVDVGEEKGVIQETEKDMIINIFEFDKVLKEIIFYEIEILF
jgi:Mg2+/Co2+ transporter CorB